MRSLATLSAFVEVASLGSFARASGRLGLSTSATSKAVARLEEELGVKLLNRTTRNVSLTPEGERFLEGARPLLAELAVLKEEVTASLETPRGLLRVSAPVALGRIRIASMTAAFQRRYPEVEIELSLDDRLTDFVADRVDLSVRAGALDDSANLVARRLFDDQPVTVATGDYLREAGCPEHPDDLRDFNCINFRNRRSGRLMPWFFNVEGTVRRQDVKGRLVIDDGQAVGDAALAARGLSQMPGFMATEALRSGELVEVLAAFRPPTVPYSAVYLDRRLVSPRIRAFVDELVLRLEPVKD